MGILREILKEMKTEDNLEKIRTICDEIIKEEEDNIQHPEILPKGPNLFIVLEVPGRVKGEIAFLALERESEDLWLSVLFITTEKDYAFREKNDPSIKRTRVWQIADHRPEKVLTEFAKRYKFLRGE